MSRWPWIARRFARVGSLVFLLASLALFFPTLPAIFLADAPTTLTSLCHEANGCQFASLCPSFSGTWRMHAALCVVGPYQKNLEVDAGAWHDAILAALPGWASWGPDVVTVRWIAQR